MKLYSHGQMIRICGAAVLIAVATTTFIFKLSSKKNNAAASVTEVSNNTDIDGASTSVAEYLEQNPAIIMPVSNTTYTQDESQNINVYNLCNEAVVNINTKVTAYDWFLEPYVQDGGSGSGSIIDKRGYILTNVHVIQDATKIYVSLVD